MKQGCPEKFKHFCKKLPKKTKKFLKQWYQDIFFNSLILMVRDNIFIMSISGVLYLSLSKKEFNGLKANDNLNA